VTGLRPTHRRAGAALLAAAAAVLAAALWRSGLVAPGPSVLLRDRHGEFLGEAGDPAGEFGFWLVDPLPERVVAATLALEDRRFWSHPGVDVAAAARALVQNLRAGRRVSGASTLAMQVARLQRPARRSYPRKAMEALTALLMTARHGRRAVLAHYLRIVPYGNRIRGIGYAARRYLDKPVADLSWAETAFLAAIPQAPARMNPFVPGGRERAVRRGQRILDELLRRGLLSHQEHDLARRQIVALAIPPAGERPREAMHAVLRLTEALHDPQARRALARRPILRTSLDLALQREVAWLTLAAVDAWEPQGARNAAVVVLERHTAQVLAWVGSADYFDARRAGAIDYARVPRSPGSALKPFVYALALERGTITPASVLDDLERGPGGIGNADEAFLGPLLPRLALANSRNVPAAELLARVGVDEAYAFFRDVGLHDGREPARRYGLGLAIGGLPVTLEALVRAYTALASDGRLLAPALYEGQPRPEPRRVVSEDTARSVALFLSDPLARLPSFARMGSLEYPFPVAVKTGTSSRFRDAWAVAFSKRALVGVWVGDPDFRPMNRLSGQRAAAELARRVLLLLHRDEQDGLSDVPFPPPRGFAAEKLCALTGRRATSACARVILEFLAPGAVPVGECGAHVRLLVDARTGRPATAATPVAAREARTLVDLPPRYAAWLGAVGLPRLPQPALGPPGESAGRARLHITSPRDGLRVLRDPETPPDHASLALRAVVDPEAPQLVWYVDGAPYQVVAAPYATRWPLRPGLHVFEARLPSGTSAARVRVQVE
jgi:penicillin-binding protein 1C